MQEPGLPGEPANPIVWLDFSIGTFVRLAFHGASRSLVVAAREREDSACLASPPTAHTQRHCPRVAPLPSPPCAPLADCGTVIRTTPNAVAFTGGCDGSVVHEHALGFFLDQLTWPRFAELGIPNGTIVNPNGPGAHGLIEADAMIARWIEHVNWRLANDARVPLPKPKVSRADMYQLAGAAVIHRAGGPAKPFMYDKVRGWSLQGLPDGAGQGRRSVGKAGGGPPQPPARHGPPLAPAARRLPPRGPNSLPTLTLGPPQIPVGRKDASTYNSLENLIQLPARTDTWEQQSCIFRSAGYTNREMVALLGSHTLGFNDIFPMTPKCVEATRLGLGSIVCMSAGAPAHRRSAAAGGRPQLTPGPAPSSPAPTTLRSPTKWNNGAQRWGPLRQAAVHAPPHQRPCTDAGLTGAAAACFLRHMRRCCQPSQPPPLPTLLQCAEYFTFMKAGSINNNQRVSVVVNVSPNRTRGDPAVPTPLLFPAFGSDQEVRPTAPAGWAARWGRAGEGGKASGQARRPPPTGRRSRVAPTCAAPASAPPAPISSTPSPTWRALLAPAAWMPWTCCPRRAWPTSCPWARTMPPRPAAPWSTFTWSPSCPPPLAAGTSSTPTSSGSTTRWCAGAGC